jgi:uncharacterized protein (TIGR04551 family)
MLRHRFSTRIFHAVALVAPLAWALLADATVAHAQNPEPPAQPVPPAGAPTPAPTTAPTTTAEPPPAPPPGPAPQPATEPPPPAPVPPREPLTAGAATAVVSPSADQQQLQQQGQQRPQDNALNAVQPSDVFSDDWWGRARPVLELHGYFRTRAELFHNFSLGRHNLPTDPQHLWPQPLDQTYADQSGTPHSINLCGPAANQPCQDKSESGANLRFRVNPELHISDNLRIMSQIDALDNVVLGSTPDAYAMKPSGMSPSGNGYSSAGYNGNAPLGAFSTTQGAPTAGVNGYQNSIAMKRVWGEYNSPIGQVRFGRMPEHWGLGMIANSGDGLDSDYQSTVDRIMFITGLKSIDLFFGGAWDFVSTGPTTASPYDVYGGQPYNTCNLCNVDEYALFVAHKTNPQLQSGMLARGDVVLNGGAYAVYRHQVLDVVAGETPQTTNTNAVNNGLDRRGAQAIIPDLWLQTLWKKFRFEAEFASIIGQIEKTPQSANISNPTQVLEFGLATQTEYRAVEDKLRLNFGFGWASGDPWATAQGQGSLASSPKSPLNEANGTGPISTFAFHPDYRVDLIFYRHLLTRVEGSYYFRPSVDYDFLRNANGQKFGGGAAVIWSRASEFVQAPGHKRDLGVELDAQLYYQAKDGSLNDDPSKLGGFYAMLQYGVFFPLAGLDYLPGQQTTAIPDWSLSSAHTVRLLLGIVY